MSGPTFIDVHKRERQGTRTISDFLQTDHRRLDGLWEEYQQSLSSGHLDEARTHFAEFALGLSAPFHNYL